MKRIITLFILMMSITFLCLAADSQSIQVKATIPQTDGLTVTVHRVLASDNTWVKTSNIDNIDFGRLYFDETYNIWRSYYYYAVDVSINSNAANWTVTHATTNITNGSENLDNNINVTFTKVVKRSDGTDSESELAKVSYADSNNKKFTKSDISGGWLRIYYGIATGNKDPDKDDFVDAPGVVPIGMDKPYGTYTGTVTLTLATQ